MSFSVRTPTGYMTFNDMAYCCLAPQRDTTNEGWQDMVSQCLSYVLGERSVNETHNELCIDLEGINQPRLLVEWLETQAGWHVLATDQTPYRTMIFLRYQPVE